MTLDAIHQRFSAALDSLVADLKGDRSVVAALLCGSLSHDVVWDKSDIDLVIVTADDRKGGPCDLALYANGINIHAFIVPRVQFRRIADGSDRNSFIHSFLTKGRLLYTHDPTIEELCATLTGVGAHDTRVQLLRAGTHALPPVYKAHKFLETRGDLNYTALWILHAAGALARIEVVSPLTYRSDDELRFSSFPSWRYCSKKVGRDLPVVPPDMNTRIGSCRASAGVMP